MPYAPSFMRVMRVGIARESRCVCKMNFPPLAAAALYAIVAIKHHAADRNFAHFSRLCVASNNAYRGDGHRGRTTAEEVKKPRGLVDLPSASARRPPSRFPTSPRQLLATSRASRRRRSLQLCKGVSSRKGSRVRNRLFYVNLLSKTDCWHEWCLPCVQSAL